MKCPHDNQELQPFRIMDSEIFSCSICQGAWIPWDVIREATRSIALTKSYPTSVNSVPSKIACPRDGSELRELTELGVRIDQCATCNGIWLDKGELKQLRDRRVNLIKTPEGQASTPGDPVGDPIVTVIEAFFAGLGLLFFNRFDDI